MRFKVGDYVVPNKPTDIEICSDAWLPIMDEYIGEVCVVCDTNYRDIIGGYSIKMVNKKAESLNKWVFLEKWLSPYEDTEDDIIPENIEYLL